MNLLRHNPADYYIFDVDGVLADSRHRQHHLVDADYTDDQTWINYYADIAGDSPIVGGLALFKSLAKTANILIFTSRNISTKHDTLEFISAHTGIDKVMLDRRCWMRPKGVHVPAVELKAQWLLSLPDPIRRCVRVAFEDTPEICDMYRSHGIVTMQMPYLGVS